MKDYYLRKIRKSDQEFNSSTYCRLNNACTKLIAHSKAYIIIQLNTMFGVLAIYTFIDFIGIPFCEIFKSMRAVNF